MIDVQKSGVGESTMLIFAFGARIRMDDPDIIDFSWSKEGFEILDDNTSKSYVGQSLMFGLHESMIKSLTLDINTNIVGLSVT
jgi:hypothetical protein